jgi:hypothetical protein
MATIREETYGTYPFISILSVFQCLYTHIPVYTVTVTPYRKTFQIKVIDTNLTIYVYFTSLTVCCVDQNRTDLPAEKTIKSEKYILLAANTEAAWVSPKYHVTSQLKIPQPEKPYVCSTTLGADQTPPVRSHMNSLYTLLSYLIYNHFNIILSYNYA